MSVPFPDTASDDGTEARLLAEAAPGDNAPALSVSQLSAAIKRTVEDGFARVRVRGELSGTKRAASGHFYAALKDDNALIDMVTVSYTHLDVYKRQSGIGAGAGLAAFLAAALGAAFVAAFAAGFGAGSRAAFVAAFAAGFAAGFANGSVAAFFAAGCLLYTSRCV